MCGEDEGGGDIGVDSGVAFCGLVRLTSMAESICCYVKSASLDVVSSSKSLDKLK